MTCYSNSLQPYRKKQTISLISALPLSTIGKIYPAELAVIESMATKSGLIRLA
jgi:hypothetical protein